MNDLTFLPAVQMAEQIRHRKISPVELVEAHLRKIKKLNPVLNAFVQVDAEGAFRQAREAEVAVRRGAKLGALHGVPVSIKSSIEVAGFRCEAGTKLRQGTVASQDAPLVSRLRDAGAIILGTTNTPELLMAWETGNRLGNVGGRSGKRRRRIDSSAGALQRNLRSEADARAHSGNWAFSEFGRAVCSDRGRGTDGTQGARFEVVV